MALPTSGPLSIADICGVDGLNISFNSPPRELHELANMAITTSIPYINRTNPSIFHWYGYGNMETTTILSSTVVIFNISRTTFPDAKTSTSSDTVTSTGSSKLGNAQVGGGATYEMGRLLAVFDTSSITTTPTDGTLSFYITTNTVPNSLTFRTVNPNTSFTPVQVITTADWNNWNGSADASGTEQGNTTVPTSTTGFFTIALSSSQLSDINTYNDFSVFLISSGDLSDTSPSTDSRPFFSAQSGLGISGVGDYKLVLNGSSTPPSTLEINATVLSLGTGHIDITGGQPFEELDLTLTLTYFDGTFGSLSITSPIVISPVDTLHDVRTGYVNLDASGNATATYTVDPSDATFNSTLEITSRSSGLPMPVSPSVGISNT